MNSAELLKGFVDLHLHAGPALMEREFGAEEAASRAARAGCRAVVLKDHHCPTMSLAKTLDQRYSPKGLTLRGGLVLNNSVGGLNPHAVEVAAGFKAAVVWMPTVSARNHQDCLKKEGVYFPPVSGTGRKPETYLTWVDGQGRLKEAVEDILDILAANPEIILATGHGGAGEVDLLVRRAKEKGLARILINHPLYMVGAREEELKAWASLGAFLEFTAIATLPDTPLYSISPARVAQVVNLVGKEKVVLSSDLGLKGCGLQPQGMAKFLDSLQEEGLGPGVLGVMTRDNPAALLGI